MIRYNISVPREYEKNGEKKTTWSNVGKLIRFEASGDKPEGFVIELFMHPETKFRVFEDKPREEAEKTIAYPAEEEEPF